MQESSLALLHPSPFPHGARAIPGFPGYAVTEEGHVWSARLPGGRRKFGVLFGKWRRLKLTPDNGYLVVSLSALGGQKNHGVHRLVLLAFVGFPLPGQEACHFDDNRSNNVLGNLRWDTPTGNMEDKVRNGNSLQGEKHHKAKLTALDVRTLRERHAGGESTYRLAREFGVDRSTVGYAVNGTTWSHL